MARAPLVVAVRNRESAAASNSDSRSERNSRPTVSPILHRCSRRQPRRDPPVRGVDGDNLGGAEILRAEHLSANREPRRRNECAPDARPAPAVAFGAILANLRDVNIGAAED